MTLLCRDHAGYLNLSQLISRGWLEGHRPEGGVAVHPDWVRDHHKNLFALIGRHSLAGQLLAKGRADLAEQQLADWQHVFGDGLHLELTRTGRDGEEPFNQFGPPSRWHPRHTGDCQQRRSLPGTKRLSGTRGARLYRIWTHA